MSSEELQSLEKQINRNYTNLLTPINEIKQDNRILLEKYITQAVQIGVLETSAKANEKILTKLEGIVWKLALMATASGSLAGAIVTAFVK